MISVQSINELKRAAQELTPSIRFRSSRVVFVVQGTNYSWKPGIKWRELWQDPDENRDGRLFNDQEEYSPGWVFDERGDGYGSYWWWLRGRSEKYQKETTL